MRLCTEPRHGYVYNAVLYCKMKILRILESKAVEGRLAFIVDSQLKTIDEQENETVKDVFTVSLRSLCKVGDNLVKLLCSNYKGVTPLLQMLLVGASCEVQQELLPKGTTLETGETLTSPQYKTELTSLTRCQLDPIVAEILPQLIKEHFSAPKATAPRISML